MYTNSAYKMVAQQKCIQYAGIFFKCLQRVCNQEKNCIQNADISKNVSKMQANNVCKMLAMKNCMHGVYK